jgi:hypothetical protein
MENHWASKAGNQLDASGIGMRLKNQIDSLEWVLGGLPEEQLRRRWYSEQWSAFENIAHLGRHHEISIERIRQIAANEQPTLQRYKAEEDSGWPTWQRKSLKQTLDLLRARRVELIQFVTNLSPDQISCTGTHPTFGTISVIRYLDFFLMHEAHHLYVALVRARARGEGLNRV